MAVTPGTRAGSYEFLAPLAAGGMGEVYRARDSRLNRDVAIKVLPAAFVEDRQRLARFEREAQLIASLNHPNIATIYGLEEFEGTGALVMELVEGPTLADRLVRGPVPLDEALPIAKQIAEAMEYAHEHGVIHRDLKPANIKLTADGNVKVLDFGLAKALAGESTQSDAAQSPTLSITATQAGIILGTAAYMSPEQARGREADKRSDIWSFGVVLFEMLSGRRAFEGETISDTLAAVLTRDPDLTELSSLPTPVLMLLRRCLQRDPKRRLRDIGEARILIEDCLADPKALSAGAPPAAPTAAAGLRPWLPWVAAGVLALATALALWRPWEPKSELHLIRSFIPPPDNTSFDFVGGQGTAPLAVSPDGRHIVFGAARENAPRMLWLQSLDAPAARPLPGTEEGGYPFWSPDSRSIGFFADMKLKRIDITGGSPIVLCETTSGRGGAWSRSGIIIFSPGPASPLHQVAEGGGRPAPVTELDASLEENSHRWPHFLPDGRRFIFLARGARQGDGVAGDHRIKLGSLDGTPSREILRGQSNVSYAAGHLLFVREFTLMARPFDAAKLEFTGEAVPLADDLRFDASFALSVFSASENGVLAFQTGSQQLSSRLHWLDRSGRETGVLADLARYNEVSLSQDALQAAVSIVDRAGPPDIWTIEVARGLRTRFTFNSLPDSRPCWSPDGARIAFASLRKGRRNLWVKPFAGSGNEELLFASELENYPSSWSPDGTLIAFESLGDPRTLADIWVLPVSGERKPVAFQQTQFSELDPQFSPDGRWIAFVSDESGRQEIYVAPFPGPGRKWQVSVSGGVMPRWRRDVREMYYLAPDNKIMAAGVNAPGETFGIGDLKPLFEVRLLEARLRQTFSAYDVTADGQRFLVRLPVAPQDLTPFSLVANWPAALKQ